MDTPSWIRDRKDKDKLAEVRQFWGSLKAYLAKSVDAANFANHRSEQMKKIISSFWRLCFITLIGFQSNAKH